MEAKLIEERTLAGGLRARIFAGEDPKYREAPVGHRLVVTTRRSRLFARIALVSTFVFLAVGTVIRHLVDAIASAPASAIWPSFAVAFLVAAFLLTAFAIATKLRGQLRTWRLVFELDAHELATQEARFSIASIQSITVEWSDAGWRVWLRRPDEPMLQLATVTNQQDARWLESKIREHVPS